VLLQTAPILNSRILRKVFVLQRIYVQCDIIAVQGFSNFFATRPLSKATSHGYYVSNGISIIAVGDRLFLGMQDLIFAQT